ncbi:phage tail terminator-like protein [Terrihabitans sp. B22-R8]|uniref:phage tail terminator-like protein n=1 Tax=Terrihabitans sp. B22-R8 TaxID=3425128 RepID=UPI00403CFA04
MASLDVVSAIETYLAERWTACPIVGALTSRDRPKNGADFLAVQYPVANSEQLTIGAPGNNVWRTEGAIRLVLHFDRQTSRETALQRADELAALFRGKHIGPVLTFAPSPPTINDDNDDGLYFRLSFAVPYQHDLIG